MQVSFRSLTQGSSAALLVMLLVAFASPAQAKHPCPPGQFIQSHRCVRYCWPGTAPNVQTGECVPCPTGSVAEGGEFCFCFAANTIIKAGACTPCPPNQVANKSHTSCSACPAGTTFQYGNCVKTQASPGILPNTTVLGTQGPGAIGTPMRAAPARGAGGPAGVR